MKTLYILNDKEAYGLGIAKNVRGAAAAAGIKVVGFSAYDPKAPNFQATFTRIQNTNRTRSSSAALSTRTAVS